MRIGILGGGLSGITLQRLLRCDNILLEKEDRVGGLCRTFRKNGFAYDIGGHILFSKDTALMVFVKHLLANNITFCRRENKILFKNRFVKYPFENGLSSLDKQDVYECLAEYILNKHPKPTNFFEWIYHTFGTGIAEKYLVPYNEKIWKHDLHDMGLEWVERVPKPPVEDIIKSALGIETEGYVHQLHFCYPDRGGIEGLIHAMKNPYAPTTTNIAIQRITKKNNIWTVSDGKQTFEFDKIVCTFPIKEALPCFDNVPDNVTAAVNNLKHNMVRVVLVGVNNESLLDKSAVYVPQSDVLFHRICYMGYFSRNTVPQGQSSVIAEITANKQHELYNVSDATLIERVVHDLERCNVLKKNDVVVTDIQNLEYGYVVYDHAYQKNISIVRDYFSSLGVELLGRFAQWEYINMDEVIRRSTRCAEQINQHVST